MSTQPNEYAIPYKTKSGRTLYKPTLGAYMEFHNENMGWCLACGCEQDGVEPDASKYTCESCGEKLVYGFDELLIMGLVDTTNAED